MSYLTSTVFAHMLAGKHVNIYGYRMLLNGEEIGFNLDHLLDIVKTASHSPPCTPEAPKKPAHGHRDDYYLLANGRHLGLKPISRVRNMLNWVLAMELLATGSTGAHQLCRDAGIDPGSTTIQRAAQLDGGLKEGG